MRNGLTTAQLLLLAFCLSLGPYVQASLIVYTDRDQFMQAISAGPWLQDDLSDLEYGYYGNPIVRNLDTPFQYTMASTSIVGLMSLGDLVTTLYPNAAIELTSAMGELQAIGGEFGLTDFEGLPDSGTLNVELQDGSGFSLLLEEAATFVGIVGVGESVNSVTFSSASKMSLVTASSIVIAAIPAPGAMPLLLVSTVFLGRSRRRRRA